jgi:hypothetical protein
MGGFLQQWFGSRWRAEKEAVDAGDGPFRVGPRGPDEDILGLDRSRGEDPEVPSKSTVGDGF